jgi:sialate O-acetylesterase
VDPTSYFVQLGRHIAAANQMEWNALQEAQREVASSVARTGIVAAVDLTFDDGIHISTPGLKKLGTRLANLATRDLFPQVKEFGTLQPGPRPMSAVYSAGVVRVVYSGVNGKLASEGRIGGFTIHGDNGELLPAIYKADIDSTNGSTVLLYVQGKMPARASVRYGYGKDSYCNLRDSADMAAPVFGPMTIKQ